MMSKPSQPLMFILYVLLFVGLVTKNRTLLALAIPFVLYIATGLFFAPQKSNLQVERILSADRVSQGIPVTVRLKITNQGASIENLQVEDILPAGLQILKGNSKLITSLKNGKTVELNYTLSGKRGYYHLPGLQIKISDLLGLIQKREGLTHSNRFLVLPVAYKLPEVAIRPRNTRVFPGLIPARKGGPGVEFFGVREYHSGDPVRWINERKSARYHGSLFVNEFEQERAVDVGLILDCRTGTNLFRDNSELLEHGTQAAATLAETFLSYGNRVGLLVYGGGRIWVHPGYGRIQRERILQALATVRLYDRVIDKELSNLPTRLFPARSQLVLISSLLYEDLPTLISLRAHGYRLLVISPDPIDFESSLLGDDPLVTKASQIARLERDFLLRQLRRSGARVFEWQVNQPFHQVARYALSHAPFWQMKQEVTRV
jgi:uncharacterized protein (DUF58 family)